MQIDAIDVFHVAHPLREPWTTAYGSDPAVHSVLVRMRSGDTVAWAESNPLEQPTYSPEYAAGVFHTVSTIMAPLVAGKEVASADALLALLSTFKGNNFSKAALEMAWWSLRSALTGQPLYALLGGSDRPVAVGEALGVTSSVEDLLERIAAAFARGYARIKLKVRPEHDFEMLQEVRRAFPDGLFHIDCNCGYSLDDLDLFRRLDTLRLFMIEQPLGYGDLLDHAKLQREIETPICLDESCTGIAATRGAIELGSCRIMNIKPPRVGGLATSLRILKLCTEAGIPCWVGSMLESSIGAASNLAMASLPGITLPSDLFPSTRFYREEITEEELDLAGPGVMRPLARPTSELVPREDRLRARTISHASIGCGR